MEKLFEQHIERMEKLQSVYEPNTGQHNILGMLINECKQALHKHSVMQAVALEGAEGATVGQRSVDTNAEGRHCGTCKYAESDNPYPCGACSGDYSLWEAPSVGHL